MNILPYENQKGGNKDKFIEDEKKQMEINSKEFPPPRFRVTSETIQKKS
jgi:hypothetical protein